MKNVYVVLGMARTGTSAIARGLMALGVDLGDKLTPADGKWNPKGFWEDSEIVYQINGKVFSTLNFPPYGICKLDEKQQTGKQVEGIRQSAIELLQQRFSSVQHWGFKDPSTVKLLAFWRSIFTELNINENYVIALRNPLAAAQSYMQLTGAELEIGLLLWLMHLLPAIEGTQGKQRIVVSYELLLSDPKQQLERIRVALNMSAETDATRVDAYADDFLDKNLHHYSFSEDALQTHHAARVVPLCVDVYNLLLKLAKDEITFESEVFAQTWQKINAELEKIYPVYGYIDVLLKRNNQLQREMRTIKKSILWKMLYPLRFIDQALRSRRQKSRESRRLVKAYG